ncbi:hypothetical protein [Dysgonomonas sp. GY617]|uniref:hypothetical protein n=1 Tax=Dysgonomonas sp. GY617 TaxID=2780420 RepID=UPI0018831FED|nr:hypothetical protein [Dysgonomonas sp. GY617]MBF0577703.1 hypothetical protein [Dysgonomonas sp. GY617]
MQSKLTNIANKIPKKGETLKNNKDMKAEDHRKKAIEVFNKYIANPQFNKRFTKEAMLNELSGIDRVIKSELRISKDLRDIEFLGTWLSLRHYYKKLISLFN